MYICQRCSETLEYRRHGFYRLLLLLQSSLHLFFHAWLFEKVAIVFGCTENVVVVGIAVAVAVVAWLCGDVGAIERGGWDSRWLMGWCRCTQQEWCEARWAGRRYVYVSEAESVWCVRRGRGRGRCSCRCRCRCRGFALLGLSCGLCASWSCVLIERHKSCVRPIVHQCNN